MKSPSRDSAHFPIAEKSNTLPRMISAMLPCLVFAHNAPFLDEPAIVQTDITRANDAARAEVISSSGLNFVFDCAATPLLALQIEDEAGDARPHPSSPEQLESHSITPAPAAPEPFGTANSSYWHINLAVGNDFDERNIARAGVGLGYFITEDVSLDWDLALAHVDQPGDDAFAVNLGMLLRWHFLHDLEKSWTLYGELGAGLLGATDDIPANGTSFNFTPQAGFGATFDIGEGSRLFTGVRWFHISNANTFEDNPAVDFAMLHLTVTFPF